jgi:hypothetical protein
MNWAVGKPMLVVSDESPEKTFVVMNTINAVAIMEMSPIIMSPIMRVVTALVPLAVDESRD